MLKFEYTFEDDPPHGDLTVYILENPGGAKVKFYMDGEGVLLKANSEGCLYLAAIFAELGTRELEDGYHFHRPDWLHKEAGSRQEVSVELDNGDWGVDA